MNSDQNYASTLRKKLAEASTAYYVHSNPIMSDQEYDALFQELVDLEAKYPELKTADSPTLRVGSDLDVDAVRIAHVRPVLSLDKATTVDGLRSWQTRNATLVRPPTMSMVLSGSDSLGYVITPKVDGLSLVVTYIDGVLQQAVTRGNAYEGDDVTENARTIRNLPLTLNNDNEYPVPHVVAVRGEVVIHKDEFEAYNKTAVQTAANPRNLASGSLKQKRSAEVAKRPLRFYAFDIMDLDGETPSEEMSSVTKMLSSLSSWGFAVVPFYHLDSLSDVIDALPTWDKTRYNFPYEMDGIVIKHNYLPYYEKLGIIGKDPRGAIAYKFPTMEVTTTLRGVRVSIGRSGVVQPTATLEPVAIGGVTVTYASLHNYEQIEALDFRLGDKVVLKRGGEVIPYLVSPVVEARKGTEKPIVPPEECPFCKAKVVKNGARYFCSNSQCPERTVRVLEYWANRDNLDIDGLGEVAARIIASSGLLKSLADLYTLTSDQLYTLQGMGSKRADNLIEAIQKSKGAAWNTVLAALGIEGVGHTTCRELYNSLNSLWDISHLTDEELIELKVVGVGETTAKSIATWFSDDGNVQLLKALEGVGFNFVKVATNLADVAPQTLAGKKFVVTGTMSAPREQIEGLIKKHGGSVGASVSKKTDYVVAGEAAGSKLDKANALGITVIDELALRLMASTITTPYDE